MADTTLVIFSNREGAYVGLGGTSALVPLDAVGGETFSLPAGFGDAFMDQLEVSLTTLSGAYAAPTPADWRFVVTIESVVTGYQDIGKGFLAQHFIDGSARPNFQGDYQYRKKVLLKQNERLKVSHPILAGAGVTGSLTLRLRALRTRQA